MGHAAWAHATARGWTIGNDRLHLELERAPAGGVTVRSLARVAGSGVRAPRNWAHPGAAAGPWVRGRGESGFRRPESAGWRLGEGSAVELGEGAAELNLHFIHDATGALLVQSLRCFPGRSTIECVARLQNTRGSVPRVCGISPISIALADAARPFALWTTAADGSHGFAEAGAATGAREEDNWIVLEDAERGESLLLGGDLGAGILRFAGNIDPSEGGARIRAGANPPASGRAADPDGTLEPAVGHAIEAPLTFLTLAEGGPDEAGNEAFRYLKRHVMPSPMADTPHAAYCAWLTDPDSERILNEELTVAKRIGFDVFYHDASWVADSSTVPGMNDWAQGLGTYEESSEKFPRGLADLSRRVRAAGMRFGLWVDPGMVDSRRVSTGEIPQAWVAMRDGKALECRHPSLSPMTQLCLGCPEVIAEVNEKLAAIVERYRLEWIKWDPSGTVSHACDRADHPHGPRSGTWAAYAGRMEIMSHLLDRFPHLIGFECDPSLRHSRTNPGPRTLLPGGYANEFITGPMVAPYVWGSLASRASVEAATLPQIVSGWCSASTLDYSLRRHFTHGVSFGNINGMQAQLLSHAPAGYLEAFRRNLLHFKRYRHLLLGDVWHPELDDADGWDALQYTAEDGSESIVFVFRHPAGAERNVVRLKALDPGRGYVVEHLNDRPGRRERFAGERLLHDGIPAVLPDPWLAAGDGLPAGDHDAQLGFGSDILLITREST